MMYPQKDEFTWEMWSHAIGGIYWFVTTYGCLDMEFDVSQAGVSGAMALGSLMMT